MIVQGLVNMVEEHCCVCLYASLFLSKFEAVGRICTLVKCEQLLQILSSSHQKASEIVS